MKFKKILEAYYDFSDEDQVFMTMNYDDTQVENFTYSGFVAEQLNILYDQADPATRQKIGDINWAQNYLAKTNNTDNKTRDFDQETAIIVLKDGIIQYADFSSKNVRSNGFLQNTLPSYRTILGGNEKYIGIRGYVKGQRLSLENQIRRLEVFKECGSGYSIADLV
jgi:hypothetical protein